MTALCVLLLIGSYFLPIIGFVLTFAVGVPLTILVVRRGLSPAIIASVAAALVISLLFGILSGVRFDPDVCAYVAGCGLYAGQPPRCRQ